MRTILPNAWIIARREFFQRVRTRVFVFSTLFIAVLAFALGLSPVLISYLDRGAVTKVQVYTTVGDLASDPVAALDLSLNGLAAAVQSNGSSSGSDGAAPRREFQVSRATNLAAGVAAVKDGSIAGLLDIERTPAGDLAFAYHTKAPPTSRGNYFVRQAATSLAIQDRLALLDISGTQQAQLFAPVTLDVVAPDGTRTSPDATDQITKVLLGQILIVLIFVTVLTYGQWVAVSVAEEKSSRVMELMLSSATPIQMLAGKVVGTGGAGLAQYGAILGAGILAILLQGPVTEAVLGGGGGPALTGLTVPILLAFGVYFVLGFVLYALLYAAAGSLVSRQEDVQQVATPLLMVGMIGYFASIFALNADANDSALVTALSFIPFFTPYLMLGRVVTGPVPAWEIVLSIVVLMVTIAVALWVAARIYSAGVLLYGQRPGLRTIVRVVRAAR